MRAERIAEEGDGDSGKAAKIVKDSDADRRSYFKRFYDVTEQPTHYDLVVNTGGLSFEQAAGVVAQAASDPA